MAGFEIRGQAGSRRFLVFLQVGTFDAGERTLGRTA
jgi:hypothetical protein